MVVRSILVIILFCNLTQSNQASAQEKSSKGQLNNWTHNSKNCHHILSNSYQCDWSFFEIKGTIEGEVIACDAVSKKDDGATAASVSILKTNKEIVRIMNLSNTALKVGQRIKVTSDKEPGVDVVVPLDRDFYIAEEKKGNKPVCRMNRYDDKVLKTAWGRVIP